MIWYVARIMNRYIASIDTIVFDQIEAKMRVLDADRSDVPHSVLKSRARDAI